MPAQLVEISVLQGQGWLASAAAATDAAVSLRPVVAVSTWTRGFWLPAWLELRTQQCEDDGADQCSRRENRLQPLLCVAAAGAEAIGEGAADLQQHVRLSGRGFGISRRDCSAR